MKAIRSPGKFVRDNLMDRVVRCGMRPNGLMFYWLENGLLYELDEQGVAFLNRLGYRPRLTPALEAVVL